MIKAKDMKSFLDYSKAVFSLFLYLIIFMNFCIYINQINFINIYQNI